MDKIVLKNSKGEEREFTQEELQLFIDNLVASYNVLAEAVNKFAVDVNKASISTIALTNTLKYFNNQKSRKKWQKQSLETE